MQVVHKTEVLARAGRKRTIPCLRCGECCRRYQVRLELAEAARIAGELGLDLETFRDRYADPRWPGERSLLVRQEDGCCVFLQRSGQGGDELCGIQSFKPLSCREWEPDNQRSECRVGLARRWGARVSSTGELTEPDEKMRDILSYVDSLAGDRRS